MKANKLRELAINASLIFTALVFLLILGTSGLILEDAKNSVFEDMRTRAGLLSKRTGAAMFPREDLFVLHMLVNTMMLEKVVKYAVVTDMTGRIRSHSDPGKIGDRDETREGAAARSSRTPLTQTFKGPDGLDYFYFSEPVMVGSKSIGTVAVAANSQSMEHRLAPTRNKLLLIFLAALAAIGLLLEIRSLMRREQRASALKSAMVHTVSHEFNNALTVIGAAFFMLQESETDRENASRASLYKAIDYERNALKNFVKNILNEVRMEAGKFRIERKPLALRDLVRSSAEAMQELMKKKSVAFSLDMPEELVMVEADREALDLVISNLVGNAVKYTPADGTIAVKLAPAEGKPGSVTFSIENSGRGISADDLKMLKTEFFRTGEGQAAAEGFGLGLKVCNDMLLLHGSALEVRSEPDKNTCFYFSLPLAASKETLK